MNNVRIGRGFLNIGNQVYKCEKCGRKLIQEKTNDLGRFYGVPNIGQLYYYSCSVKECGHTGYDHKFKKRHIGERLKSKFPLDLKCIYCGEISCSMSSY